MKSVYQNLSINSSAKFRDQRFKRLFSEMCEKSVNVCVGYKCRV